MLEQNKGPLAPAPGKSPRRRRKRAETTVVGAVVILLAVVGLVFLVWRFVSFSVGYVKDYLGPTENVKFFSDYISPVVMQDPDPFGDAKKLSPDFIVKTAIWAALMDDENSGKYAYTDDDRQILPKADVQKQIARLFGEDIKPDFHTFTDNATSATYEYSKKDGCFFIPMIAYNDYFTPNVRSIVRSKGTVRLTVDYISGQGWVQDSQGQVTPPPASKTMIYILKGARGRYRVVSVAAAPSSSAASSVAASAAGSVPGSSGSAVSSAPASSGS